MSTRNKIASIIASDLRFSNVDVDAALANYEDSVRERNATRLPEFTVTVTKPKLTTYKDINPNISYLDAIRINAESNPINRTLNYGAKNFKHTFGISLREVGSWIPFVGDALAIEDISKDFNKGNYGSAALGAGLFLLPNVIEKPLKSVGKELKHFVSELDWRPSSWFGTRANGKYDSDDIKSLASHISEYLDIERTAKANDTWLKMPDGSIWEGDPRTWVQMQSNNYKSYGANTSEVLYHGSPTNKIEVFRTPSDKNALSGGLKATGEEGIYFSPSKTGAGRYTTDFYSPKRRERLGLPPRDSSDVKTIYNVTTNAKLMDVDDIRLPENLNFMDLSHEDRKLIENLGYQGLRYTANNPKNSETVIFDPYRIKSLLGNNGDFSHKNPNMYKSLLPLIPVGTGIAINKLSGANRDR